MSRFFLTLLFIFGFSTSSYAQEVHDQDEPWLKKRAFDRSFALGAYGLSWSGAYNAVGLGLKTRWEPFDLLGVDLYSEHLIVKDKNGFRHDHPIGFNLYLPLEIFDDFRIRPLFGFCAIFSFTDTKRAGTERIDDIMFGVHMGGGLEYSMGRFFSIYYDAQVTGYLGHQRYDSPGGWSIHVGDHLDTWAIMSHAIGFQFHL